MPIEVIDKLTNEEIAKKLTGTKIKIEGQDLPAVIKSAIIFEKPVPYTGYDGKQSDMLTIVGRVNVSRDSITFPAGYDIISLKDKDITMYGSFVMSDVKKSVTLWSIFREKTEIEKRIPIDKEYLLNWETIQQLPEARRKMVIDHFLSDYEWIQDHTIDEEEAEKILNENPIVAKYTEYGIHGIQVSVEFKKGLKVIHWDTYGKEDFYNVMKF